MTRLLFNTIHTTIQFQELAGKMTSMSLSWYFCWNALPLLDIEFFWGRFPKNGIAHFYFCQRFAWFFVKMGKRGCHLPSHSRTQRFTKGETSWLKTSFPSSWQGREIYSPIIKEIQEENWFPQAFVAILSQPLPFNLQYDEMVNSTFALNDLQSSGGSITLSITTIITRTIEFFSYLETNETNHDFQ